MVCCGLERSESGSPEGFTGVSLEGDDAARVCGSLLSGVPIANLPSGKKRLSVRTA